MKREAAAAVTSTITLGTAVALPVEDDPITLAKSSAALDHPSGGRLILGVGFGWNIDELTDHGVPGRDGDPEIVVLDFTLDADTLERRREVGVTEVVYGMPTSPKRMWSAIWRGWRASSAHTL